MDYSDSPVATQSSTTASAGSGADGGGRQRSSAGDSLTLSKEGLAALLKSQVPGGARSAAE